MKGGKMSGETKFQDINKVIRKSFIYGYTVGIFAMFDALESGERVGRILKWVVESFKLDFADESVDKSISVSQDDVPHPPGVTHLRGLR
jgi:hypothetical protein